MNGLIGFTPASFVTGVSNNVFAIDNDTGYPVWHRKLDAPLPAPTAQCPGGVTGAAGRVVSLVREPLQLPAPAAPGRGYRGGIGAPGEGVPMEIARRDGGAALRGASPIPAARGGGGGVFAGRYAGPVYVVSSNGTLHALGQVSAVDLERPAPFLPPNARYSDLTAIGEHVVHEHQQRMRRRCEWRLGDHAGSEEQDRELVEDERRQPCRQSRVHGRRQDSRGDRSRYDDCRWIRQCDRRARRTRHCSRSTGSRVRRLQFVTTPVVINHGGREIVAAATRDAIFLLDAASLGGANHSTPLFVMQTDKLRAGRPGHIRAACWHSLAARAWPARDRRVQDCG